MLNQKLPLKSRLHLAVSHALESLRLQPTVWSVGNAFKIHEFKQIVEPSGLSATHTALDLGCGTGLQTVLLARRCARVIGIDVFVEAIQVAKERASRCGVADRIDFRASPIEKAQLKADSIDRVYSFCVLEHIANLDVVLAELYRIMKPGAEMHITVDSLANVRDQKLVDKHRKDHFVVEYFTPASLTKRLEKSGFELFDIHPLFTSELARKAFEDRIINGGHLSLLNKLRLYRELRLENAKDAKEGIMVLARARKPIAAKGR